MRADGLTYGKTWSVEFFEQELRCAAATPEFQFAMIPIQAAIEWEDGYYLKSSENGRRYSIPQPMGFLDESNRLKHRALRDTRRSYLLLDNTLNNPAAMLAEADRKKMETRRDQASVRMALLTRSRSVEKVVLGAAPKLLAQKS